MHHKKSIVENISTNKTLVALLFGIISLQALALYIFGQPAICECGFIKIWEPDVLGPGNSQHISDWYTFSHIIHGFLFYGLLHLLFPKLPVWQRLLMALSIEVAWEIAENTPYVINAYREQALAQGYTGDSILNSLMDSVAMLVGFLLVHKWRIWIIILLAITMEVFTAYMIHDNLTLNILNFVHQFDFISEWAILHMRVEPKQMS